jgi:hypothetical protein
MKRFLKSQIRQQGGQIHRPTGARSLFQSKIDISGTDHRIVVARAEIEFVQIRTPTSDQKHMVEDPGTVQALENLNDEWIVLFHEVPSSEPGDAVSPETTSFAVQVVS